MLTGRRMISKDCIEEIRDAINQIEFYVELKINQDQKDGETVQRRYRQDIGEAIAQLVDLRMDGRLSDEALQRWQDLPIDHSEGFITCLVKLIDRLKRKYIA